MTKLVTFAGGGGNDDRVIFNDQVPLAAYSYNFTPTAVTRQTVFGGLNYSDTDRLVLNCGSAGNTVRVLNAMPAMVEAYGNGGPDTFIVGGGNMNGFQQPHLFDGGNGIDQIAFDDSQNPVGKIWDIGFNPNEIAYSGLTVLGTAGFESVGILAGLGADQIHFYNDPTQHYDVNGGGGSDPFTWHGGDNWFRDPDNGGAVTHYQVNFDGGGDGEFDTLLFDDATRGPTEYDITADSLIGIDADIQIYAELLSYSDFWSVSVQASNVNNVFNLTSAAATTNYLLQGNDGPDHYAISIDPAAATAGGYNVDCRGGAGTDVLTMNDSGYASPASYAITSSSITRVGDGSSRFFSHNSIESLSVTGTADDDTFGIGGFTTGAALAVRGGDGDDTLNFGNTAVTIVTGMSSFLFDGQAGVNTFNLNNPGETNQWAYENTAATIRAQCLTGPPAGYLLPLGKANIQRMNINAGSGTDVLTPTGVATGEALALRGGDGTDAINLPGDLSAIHGPIFFYGGGGATNNINHLSNPATAPITVHLDQNSLGAYPGDSFFPAGGALYFQDVTNMSVRLGSGEDTAYVQPNALAAISINGGNPTGAPGDTLNLALAVAAGYSVNPTSATAGNVTSANLKTLTYSSFESGPNIDEFAPVVANIDFAIGAGAGGAQPAAAIARAAGDDEPIPGGQSMTVTFSEDVAAFLDAGDLLLFNMTTAEFIPAADIALDYDPTTFTATFTFPNYTGGLLPDGVYQAQIGGGLADAFGNAMATSDIYTFIWSAGTDGD